MSWWAQELKLAINLTYFLRLTIKGTNQICCVAIWDESVAGRCRPTSKNVKAIKYKKIRIYVIFEFMLAYTTLCKPLEGLKI